MTSSRRLVIRSAVADAGHREPLRAPITAGLDTVQTGGRRRRSFRVLLAAAFGVIALLASGGAALLAQQEAVAALRDDAAADLTEAARGLAEILDRRGLERALDEADGLRLLDVGAIERVLHAHPDRRGARRLAALLGDARLGDTLTRSELEERVLALCDCRGLPRPLVNARVAGLEVDFHWPSARLVVEADSRRHHLTAAMRSARA